MVLYCQPTSTAGRLVCLCQWSEQVVGTCSQHSALHCPYWGWDWSLPPASPAWVTGRRTCVLHTRAVARAHSGMTVGRLPHQRLACVMRASGWQGRLAYCAASVLATPQQPGHLGVCFKHESPWCVNVLVCWCKGRLAACCVGLPTAQHRTIKFSEKS